MQVIENTNAQHFSLRVVLMEDVCVSPPDCEQLDHRTSDLR